MRPDEVTRRARRPRRRATGSGRRCRCGDGARPTTRCTASVRVRRHRRSVDRGYRDRRHYLAQRSRDHFGVDRAADHSGEHARRAPNQQPVPDRARRLEVRKSHAVHRRRRPNLAQHSATCPGTRQHLRPAAPRYQAATHGQRGRAPTAPTGTWCESAVSPTYRSSPSLRFHPMTRTRHSRSSMSITAGS